MSSRSDQTSQARRRPFKQPGNGLKALKDRTPAPCDELVVPDSFSVTSIPNPEAGLTDPYRSANAGHEVRPRVERQQEGLEDVQSEPRRRNSPGDRMQIARRFNYPMVSQVLETVENPTQRMRIFREEVKRLQRYPAPEGGVDTSTSEWIKELERVIQEASFDNLDFDRVEQQGKWKAEAKVDQAALAAPRPATTSHPEQTDAAGRRGTGRGGADPLRWGRNTRQDEHKHVAGTGRGFGKPHLAPSSSRRDTG